VSSKRKKTSADAEDGLVFSRKVGLVVCQASLGHAKSRRLDGTEMRAHSPYLLEGIPRTGRLRQEREETRQFERTGILLQQYGLNSTAELILNRCPGISAWGNAQLYLVLLLIRGEGFGNCGWIEGKISLEPDYTPLHTAKPALWKGRSNPSFVVVLYLPQALYG